MRYILQKKKRKKKSQLREHLQQKNYIIAFFLVSYLTEYCNSSRRGDFEGFFFSKMYRLEKK